MKNKFTIHSTFSRRFIFFANNPEAQSLTPNEAPNDEKEQAQKAVIKSLNKEIVEALSDKVNSPILNDNQITKLKESGVNLVKLEKSLSGADSTALYFDQNVNVYANGKRISGSRAFITHHDTKSVELAPGLDPNVTVIKINNKDGTTDELILEKKDSDAPAQNAINKLKETVKLPIYIASKTSDGKVLAIFEDNTKSSYKERFVVFYGAPESINKLNVSNANRSRDGGTTDITADGHNIHIPSVFAGGDSTLDAQVLKTLL